MGYWSEQKSLILPIGLMPETAEAHFKLGMAGGGFFRAR
jgi:hypothetical protein